MTPNPHCRVRNIDFKSGGSVRIVDFDKLANREAHHLVTYAGQIARDRGLAGFVIVGWDNRGEPFTSFSQADDGPVPLLMLPSFCRDALRERMTVGMAMQTFQRPST